MKKLIVFAALAVFGFSNVNAQSSVEKVVDQAKNGGFKVGANIGFAFINSNRYAFNTGSNEDFGSFNFGVDVAYLFEVIPNLEVGMLTGYTQFLAEGNYTKPIYDYNGFPTGTVNVDFKDASFIPIAASARYYFLDRQLFAGLDLGYAIKVGGDDEVNGGLFLRPKFGYNMGMVSLIASYQRLGGNADYSNGYYGGTYYSLSGFSSFNVGAEFSF